ILDKANKEKEQIISEAQNEANEWKKREEEKLYRETNLVIQDSRKRAEDIRRRQILNAEREKSTETLRLQNRVLSDALSKLHEKLTHLRERDDYAEIITGMCIEASQALKGSSVLYIKLATVDAPLADKIIANLARILPNITFKFDSEPASILGGCWVTTDDKRRQVNLDWQNITRDTADKLAERLIPLL
ncbi:MAG: V-type ATP synthase subunit E, partial [Synergistaceae bacterium]